MEGRMEGHLYLFTFFLHFFFFLFPALTGWGKGEGGGGSNHQSNLAHPLHLILSLSSLLLLSFSQIRRIRIQENGSVLGHTAACHFTFLHFCILHHTHPFLHLFLGTFCHLYLYFIFIFVAHTHTPFYICILFCLRKVLPRSCLFAYLYALPAICYRYRFLYLYVRVSCLLHTACHRRHSLLVTLFISACLHLPAWCHILLPFEILLPTHRNNCHRSPTLYLLGQEVWFVLLLHVYTPTLPPSFYYLRYFLHYLHVVVPTTTTTTTSLGILTFSFMIPFWDTLSPDFYHYLPTAFRVSTLYHPFTWDHYHHTTYCTPSFTLLHAVHILPRMGPPATTYCTHTSFLFCMPSTCSCYCYYLLFGLHT